MKIRSLPYLIWLISALFYMYEFIHRISISIIIEELVKEFSFNSYDISNISAVYFFSYAMFQIPAGIIVDRFGINIVYKSAMLVALGCFIFSQSHNIISIKIARIIIGIGSAFSFISCLKIIILYFKNKKHISILIGITNCLGITGALIGGAPFAKLVDILGWRDSIFFLFIVSFFFGVILFFVTTDVNMKNTKINLNFYKNSLLVLIKSKQNWFIAIFGSLMISPIIVLSELWGTQFLLVKYDFNKEFGSFLSSLTFLGIGIGGIVNGYISYLLKTERPVLLYGNLGSFICVLLIIYLNFSIPILIILHFLFGFFTSSMLLCFTLAIKKSPKHLHGTVIGFLNTIIMTGSVFFQPLTGYLLNNNLQEYHFKKVFIILPICLIISFIIQYFIEETNDIKYDKSSC